MQTAVAFICTRIRDPDVHDERIEYWILTQHKRIAIILGLDGSKAEHWHIDATFADNNMRGHTGITLSLGSIRHRRNKAKCPKYDQSRTHRARLRNEPSAVDEILRGRTRIRHRYDNHLPKQQEQDPASQDREVFKHQKAYQYSILFCYGCAQKIPKRDKHPTLPYRGYACRYQH